jgi:hypothetical protein
MLDPEDDFPPERMFAILQWPGIPSWHERKRYKESTSWIETSV